MKHLLPTVFLLKTFLNLLSARCTGREFQSSGDFVLGGLFDVHYASQAVTQSRPEALDCSRQDLVVPSYRRFQMMRFAIEEINNSSTLLPNVSLGYSIFDHCSSIHNFPSIFQFISLNKQVQPWYNPSKGQSDITAVVGPFSSSDTTTIAPLLMMSFVPTISYGAGSSEFSEKIKFPSFLRTVHSNKDLVEVIVNILFYYNWRWVAFLNSMDAYGNDGLELFTKRIIDTPVCMAYSQGIDYNTNASQVVKQIDSLNVKVVVVFLPEGTAEHLIGTIAQLNITKKVWIAVDAWSLNKNLPQMKGIHSIGTVIGISQPTVHIVGFNEFIYSTLRQCDQEPGELCNQYCRECEKLTPEDVISSDPSYSFNVYTAVYTIANALHNMLRCGSGECQKNTTVYHYQVLAELRRSNFTLMDETINFDQNFDPKFGSYSIVFWNSSGDAEDVGFYKFTSADNFYINTSKIQWHTNGEIPTSLCSSECSVGYFKEQEGQHKCCFTCHLCPNETYINVTVDEYSCLPCGESEWSSEGSTSCTKRTVEFVPFEHAAAIVIVFGAAGLVGLSLLTSVLFALNYHTPVVRSAGGPMCFLILASVCLSSISVFFYFGVPSVVSCLLRYFPFLLFFSICLACFVVRSFQIVCIFKIAAKYPSIQRWWMKYHGQWLIISLAFGTQALLLIFGYSFSPPATLRDTDWEQSQIILSCGIDFAANSAAVILLLVLCWLCFTFSYMGKDLPKNYNEAKSITFCLLLIILTWVAFATAFILYQGKYIQTLNALAVVSSLYSFLLWYFLPKCYIIIFQPQRNTPQYFQGLIQNYTKTISQ